MTLKHFKPSEFACKCCQALPTEALMQKVEDIREAYGHPITVVSGKRCEKHNVEVGGAKKSAHIEGIACDLERTPELLTFITANLEKFDLNMEDPHVTTQWIHIDLRHRPTRIFKP